MVKIFADFLLEEYLLTLSLLTLGDGITYKYHPLSAAFAVAHPDVKLERQDMTFEDPFQQPISGLETSANDVRWYGQDGTIAEALLASLTAFANGTKQEHMIPSLADIKEIVDNCTYSDEFPYEMALYTPSTRPTFVYAPFLPPKEPLAALVARKLGFALVIVYQKQHPLVSATTPSPTALLFHINAKSGVICRGACSSTIKRTASSTLVLVSARTMSFTHP